MGPATTGRPASHPAIDGPHHLPDIETNSRNKGTSVSLSASMAKTRGYKVRYYQTASMYRALPDNTGDGRYRVAVCLYTVRLRNLAMPG